MKKIIITIYTRDVDGTYGEHSWARTTRGNIHHAIALLEAKVQRIIDQDSETAYYTREAQIEVKG